MKHNLNDYVMSSVTSCYNFTNKTKAMNIYLKERKKTVFVNYKTVRNTIHLNKINTDQKDAINTQWASNWLDQVTEMKTESTLVNQTAFRNNKLIIKWWEN